MRILTDDKQKMLDEYIRNNFGWLGDETKNMSEEMENAIWNTFRFEGYLLGVYWNL